MKCAIPLVILMKKLVDDACYFSGVQQLILNMIRGSSAVDCSVRTRWCGTLHSSSFDHVANINDFKGTAPI